MQPVASLRPGSRVLRGVLALFTVLACATKLGAQPTGGGPVDYDGPTVRISPSDVTVVGAQVSVTVSWHDDVSLNFNTDTIRLNGVVVTHLFTNGPVTSGMVGVQAKSTGTLTLQPGINQITATIRDHTGKPPMDALPATITYVAGRADVAVLPDGGFTHLASGGTRTLTGKVKNTGTAAGTFLLASRCRDGWSGAAVSCSPGVSSATIAAGDSASVSVNFPGGAVDGILFVQLTATRSDAPGVTDAGWADVAFTGAGGTSTVPLGARLVDLNSTGTIARDQCVAVAVAPGAAMECGDLRMAHALPGVRVIGKTKAPVLLYNSAHLSPTARLYADVTLPSGAAIPSQVKMFLIRSDGSRDSTLWLGSRWEPGTTRRVAMLATWPGSPTGLHAYSLEVVAVYPNGTRVSSPLLNGEVALVNRANSEFGPGWWLAGYERLHFVYGGRIMWVGGDGSTRLYSPAPNGTWVAQTVDRPDTLFPTAYPHATYERRLPGGGKVTFYSDGRHAATVNRLDQHTHFANDNYARLAWVAVPRQTRYDGQKLKYHFHQNANNKIVTITAPDINDNQTRTVSISRNAAHQITSITDPDNRSISFGYSGAYVATRTDRRGVVTRFTYGDGSTLASARMELAPGDSIINRYEAVEGKGFNAPPSLAVAYTLLDGPRTDVNDHTVIWPGRWGAPRRIRDAAGAETLLTRGNATYPALVTEVRGSDATGIMVVKSTAAHDFRGRVQSTTVVNPLGDNANVTTTYTYDDRWDAVTSITSPGSAPVTMAYDPVNGNRLWQQVGDASRRVTFSYAEGWHQWHPMTGLLSGVHSPPDAEGRTAVQTMEYDWWGNLVATRTPLGFYTRYYPDALGRDTLVITPVDAANATSLAGVEATGVRQRIVYDIMGRVLRTESIGRPQTFQRTGIPTIFSTPEEIVTVVNTYDPVRGDLVKVERWSDPLGAGSLFSEYQYDRAGRKIAQREGVEPWEGFQYDHAGNVVTWTTKRGNQVTTEYDALGRAVRRATPSVSYAPQSVNCEDQSWPGCSFQYPKHPNNAAGGYTVRGDTAYFEFDLQGNLRRAENQNAIITRSYYPGGALKTDSTYLRGYGVASFGNPDHVYGLEYGYDNAGRLSWLEHPENLASVDSRDRFIYDQVTGALDSIQSRRGPGFGYEYDLAGHLTRDTYPDGANVYRYDVDGRRVYRGGAYTDSTVYDARGKILLSHVGSGVTSDQRNHYSGLGMLVATDWTNGNNAAVNTEEFRVDGLGHVQWNRTANDGSSLAPEHTYTYHVGTSRLREIGFTYPPGNYDRSRYSPDSTFRSYDPAGNVDLGMQRFWTGTYRKVYTKSYYGADEKLYAQQTYDERGPLFGGERRGSFVTFRYDALGRRVLVRTQRNGLCRTGQPSSVDCTSGIERFVWAGDNILWEMRGPGGDSIPQEEWEKITGSGIEYGLVGYTHAAGVDRPLVAWKQTAPGIGGDVVVPHMNWRGLFGRGTTENGAVSTAQIEWPGFQTSAYHQQSPTQPTYKAWWGSVLEGQRDAGGTMYMRNRYYDPATGQFTQTDPIGIAGGMNVYGFGAGDPVGNWDPFGTCAWGIGPDAAFGRCGDSSLRPQDRHACTRDATGWCVGYTATPNQWSRLEDVIRRMSRRTAYCAGARSELLALWRRGREARGIRFWDGYFLTYDDAGELDGQNTGYAGLDHVELDPQLAFEDPQVVPHEGLHLYYRKNVPLGLDYVKDYQPIHRMIHRQDNECAR